MLYYLLYHHNMNVWRNSVYRYVLIYEYIWICDWLCAAGSKAEIKFIRFWYNRVSCLLCIVSFAVVNTFSCMSNDFKSSCVTQKDIHFVERVRWVFVFLSCMSSSLVCWDMFELVVSVRKAWKILSLGVIRHPKT